MVNFLRMFFLAIPQWLYVVMLLVLCVVAVGIFTHRDMMRQQLKRLLGVMYVEYLVLMLGSTIVFRDASCSLGVNFMPFWNYTNVTMDVVLETLFNIAMFVPVGFCTAVFLKHPTARKIFLFSVALSCTIELSQYLFAKGFCETNDVMNNSLGGLMGYGIYCMRWSLGFSVRRQVSLT